MAGWLVGARACAGPAAVTPSAIEAAFRGLGWSPASRARAVTALREWLAPAPPARAAARPTWSTARGPRRRRCPRLSQARRGGAGRRRRRRARGRPGRWPGARPARPGAAGGALRQRAAAPGGLRPRAGRARLRARVAAGGGQGRPGPHRAAHRAGRRGPAGVARRRAARGWWPGGPPQAATRAPVFVSRSGRAARRLDGLPRSSRASCARRGAPAGRTCCATPPAPTCWRGPGGRDGAHLRVVQEVLGHASLATTQRYTGVTTKAMQAALRRGHPRG